MLTEIAKEGKLFIVTYRVGFMVREGFIFADTAETAYNHAATLLAERWNGDARILSTHQVEKVGSW